jgi:hypothetical protein
MEFPEVVITLAPLVGLTVPSTMKVPEIVSRWEWVLHINDELDN